MAGPDYLSFLDRMAKQYGIPVEEARAIYELETSSGRNVRRSPAGAIGPMQLMPGTARELGVDPNDPYQNIKGGVSYYAQQRKRFGDPALAAAAYNAGPGRVQRSGNRVPGIPETQSYVSRFLKQIGRVQPSQSAPASVTTDMSGAPQGLTGMDENEAEDATVGGLGALGGLTAPTGAEWADWQQQSAKLREERAATQRSQFEEGQKLIQQMYGGPSASDRLWALSRALLSPKPYRGFAGTLSNLTEAFSGMDQKRQEAERSRAEALLGLQQSYQKAGLASGESDLERQLEFLKARQTATKPAKARTGFNPVTGQLTDLDSGLPITPPPPKVGEIRKGYRYIGGEPASPSSWRKVV